MPSESVLAWFKECLQQGSGIVYLDPAICCETIQSPNLSWQRLFFKADWHTNAMLTKVSFALDIHGERSRPEKYLDEKGPGRQLIDDRQLQRKVAKIITDAVDMGHLRHFTTVGALLSDGDLLKRVADARGIESVVVVDSMFCSSETAPDIVRGQLRVPATQKQGLHRDVEGCLTPEPAGVMVLGDPVLPLLMDRRAAANWTDAFQAVMEIGWYPFVRTVGLFQTTADAQPYLDVLAMLFAPWPTPNRLFGSSSNGQCKEDLNALLSKLTKDKVTPAVDGTKKVPPEKVGLAVFREIFLPLQLIELFGELNQLSKSMLSTLSVDTMKRLMEYHDTVLSLVPHLDTQCAGLVKGSGFPLLSH